MKKKHFIAIFVLLILTFIVGGLVMKANNDKRLEEQQKELERAYSGQILAFYLGGPNEYRPLPDSERSEDGVSYVLYFDLAYYRKTTGESLTFDDVKEYLSQEYEDDGEIRVYTNGRHPEIAKYIGWFFEEGCYEKRTDYGNKLVGICGDYYRDKAVAVEFEYYFPNRAVMDEVIKKEADPNYVMNDEVMLAEHI